MVGLFAYHGFSRPYSQNAQDSANGTQNFGPGTIQRAAKVGLSNKIILSGRTL